MHATHTLRQREANKCNWRVWIFIKIPINNVCTTREKKEQLFDNSTRRSTHGDQLNAWQLRRTTHLRQRAHIQNNLRINKIMQKSSLRCLFGRAALAHTHTHKHAQHFVFFFFFKRLSLWLVEAGWDSARASHKCSLRFFSCAPATRTPYASPRSMAQSKKAYTAHTLRTNSMNWINLHKQPTLHTARAQHTPLTHFSFIAPPSRTLRASFWVRTSFKHSCPARAPARSCTGQVTSRNATQT